MSPHPLAFAMDGLAAACDARGWRLSLAYNPGSRSPWSAHLTDASLEPVLGVQRGGTMEEALTALWSATQRHCRELAATGPVRRAGEAQEGGLSPAALGSSPSEGLGSGPSEGLR